LILYYITDRQLFPGNEGQRRECLLAKVAEAAYAGIDFIQLREKDLPSKELEALARVAVARLGEGRRHGSKTKLLINSRSDIALVCGADGVHLTSADVSAGDVRALWMRSRPGFPPVIGVSCHTVAEVRMAESQGADFSVFAPVFGKRDTGAPGVGLAALSAACGRTPEVKLTEAPPQPKAFPVLALGGVTPRNAGACLQAGAAGIAGIRIFQEHSIDDVVKRLRALEQA
jgi:thiamine-phosphate pyrophosphorylase